MGGKFTCLSTADPRSALHEPPTPLKTPLPDPYHALHSAEAAGASRSVQAHSRGPTQGPATVERSPPVLDKAIVSARGAGVRLWAREEEGRLGGGGVAMPRDARRPLAQRARVLVSARALGLVGLGCGRIERAQRPLSRDAVLVTCGRASRSRDRREPGVLTMGREGIAC